MSGRSALTAALAGDGPGAGARPLKLDAVAFPCLASGAAPADAGGDAVADLATGFDRASLGATVLAGSAPTATLLADGSAAVREEGECGG
jgi:hypothetical protein